MILASLIQSFKNILGKVISLEFFSLLYQHITIHMMVILQMLKGNFMGTHNACKKKK